jgi:hypothetical protein
MVNVSSCASCVPSVAARRLRAAMVLVHRRARQETMDGGGTKRMGFGD